MRRPADAGEARRRSPPPDRHRCTARLRRLRWSSVHDATVGACSTSSLKNVRSPSGTRAKKADSASASPAPTGRNSTRRAQLASAASGIHRAAAHGRLTVGVTVDPVRHHRQRPAPGALADDQADMAGRQPQLLHVGRTHEGGERTDRVGRHDVVGLTHHVQERHGDVGQPHRPPAEADLAVGQLVAAVEHLGRLAEARPGEGDVVVGPLGHGLVALDELVVPEVLPQVRVRRQVGGRLEHLERAADHVRRHVAGLVHRSSRARRAPPAAWRTSVPCGGSPWGWPSPAGSGPPCRGCRPPTGPTAAHRSSTPTS